MQSKRGLFVLVLLALIFTSAQPGLASPGQAPLLAGGEIIPDRYIVVFKDAANQEAVDAALGRLSRERGVVAHFRYADALKGFAATLPARALEIIRAHPDVAYVEADQVITLDTTQTGATWGLDRIDQRNLPLNGTFIYTRTGSGVKAYIIDTGIRISHSQFGGRASYGTDTVDGDSNANDCNGHGTHVAGTVGGSTYGVAKAVTLIAVRVLNCSGSGTTSGVIAGVNWVTGNHQAGQPAVANMSLGGGASTSLDNAVRNSIADGVTYALAAGNEGINACNRSPARVAEGITVGATNSTDTRPSWSNRGSCLDLFAPGVSITSAWSTSDSATNTISGTSMATPHVAGVAALYLQGNPGASPSTVRNALVNNATTGVVKNRGANSPNRLLYTNY
jgi:subtilisin family serine protease